MLTGSRPILFGILLSLATPQASVGEYRADKEEMHAVGGMLAQATTSSENTHPPLDQRNAAARAAQQVVERYLELSANGAWLTYDGRIQIGHLTDWTPGEHNLMSIRIISSYRVLGATSRGNSAEVIVEFDDVGWLIEDFYKFGAERRKSSSVFRLAIKKEGAWQIVEPDSPFILWPIIVKYLNRIAPNMANPAYFRELADSVAGAAKQPLPDSNEKER